MTAATTIHGLAVTDLLILVGVLGYLTDRLLDAKGWSRSSKTLRRENEDLVRRNGELEQTVSRHEETIAVQGRQLELLEEKVRELEQRDQRAVLDALGRHEQSAERRHQENQAIWTSILNTLREKEAA